jgi:hypothetical protein
VNALRPAPTTPTPRQSTEVPASAADQRQEEILKLAIDQPPDPALGRAFSDMNARHFGGLLPSMPVVWEPRLAQVGSLSPEAFTLEGMFGHIGDRSVILLNPGLARDQDALRRALSHEMVHAYLYTIGDASADHGPAFQATLRRLADEGAFAGIVATERERESLRAWLEAESARLDGEGADTRRLSETLAHDAREIEQLHAALQVRARTTPSTGMPGIDAAVEDWTRRRDAHNLRVDELRARTDRNQNDRVAFNEQIERYNLMLSYPDGLEKRDVIAHRR